MIDKKKEERLAIVYFVIGILILIFVLFIWEKLIIKLQ